MIKGKYYDSLRKLMLDPQEDGCSYKEWIENYNNFPFAIHPNGFLVFLSPSELETRDEYKENDPYTVELNLESDFHQNRIQCTLELIKSVISQKGENIKILDLGCGQGHISSKIQEYFPMAEISGLDCSVSAIKYAVCNFQKIDFIVADGYNPPYSEGYFDIVVCNNLWEHVPDPVFLLKNIRRIIKVGGNLIVSTPSRYHIENLMRVILGKSVLLTSHLHITEYSVGQVIEQLKFGGFEVVDVYSKTIKRKTPTFKRFVMFRILQPILRAYLRKVASHHSLECVVFFLARRFR